MKDAFKNWLGPVLGTVIFVTVATAFVASGFAYAGERDGHSADDLRVVETTKCVCERFL